MANVNLTEASCAVVLDTGLWMGTIESSTAWLNGIAGVSAGDAAEGVKLMIVDLVLTAAGQSTNEFDLTDTGISGVVGTTAHAVLGLHNQSGGFEDMTLVRTDGSSVKFTNPANTDGDTVRLTLLYS